MTLAMLTIPSGRSPFSASSASRSRRRRASRGGAFSALGHVLSIAAFGLADASTLAPLVYVELVGAAVVGYVAFDEVPSPTTIVGGAFIVVAGLVLLAAQRRVGGGRGREH